MNAFKSFAAKSSLVLAMSVGGLLPAHAGIPVIDGANLSQTLMTALENIMQTAKQIEQYEKQLDQYKTQLQQYDNMLQNTAKPVQDIWDQAQSTISQLRQAVNSLDSYKQQLGSIDAYVSKFQDVNYYKSSPCFNGGSCTDATRAALLSNQQTFGSESQKKANDALFRGLDKQQDGLDADAKTLQRLQQAAKGADGQVAAIGYSNQLASAAGNQLLQIRSLMIAQQNSIATRQQAQSDDEAMRAAASMRARGGAYTASPVKVY